jgi:peroxiredoxin
MTRLTALVGSFVVVSALAAQNPAPAPTVAVGKQAPAFQFKDQSGKTIDLADLFAKGPVLVRLTCGCSGCDKELAYFQEIDAAYKAAGLTSVAIFRENDDKVAKYAKEKKINMLYGVDSKGAAWNVFQTKSMPTNFLISKGGEILAIAPGCDTTGLLAKKLSEKIAKTVDAPAVDVKTKVEESNKKK